MSKTPLTEKDLNDTSCYDFSIQTLLNGKDFLILICKEKEGRAKLLDILHNNAFDLEVLVDEETGNYSLEVHFINSGVAFRLDTGRNELNYPPLKKLRDSKIKFITTGVWAGESKQGRACEYDPRLMRLGLLNIGESFKQANSVQFIAGESEKEPSVVVLIYNDYDHIFQTDADEAYNKLIDMSKGRPILGVTPAGPGTVNLRIWDILIDMDIQFDGLKYSEEQLKAFTSKTGENNSFGFALGFSPSGRERAALASTKHEGFELVTLRGYKLN